MNVSRKLAEEPQCTRPGCAHARYYAWNVCQAHSEEIMERRRQASAKASATKRERYPDRFYALGAPRHRHMNWQSYAQAAVRRARLAGILPDLSTGEYACTDCSGVASQYDHRDYSRPLDVEPVCAGCNHRRGKASIPTADRFAFRKIGEVA